MSKRLEEALTNAQNSKIYVMETERGLRLEIENVSILWPDFSGRITQYHKTLGEKRTFNVVLNQEMYNTIKAIEAKHGFQFKIHEADLYSEQDVKEKGVDQVTVLYINVKVNIANEYPPLVVLHTDLVNPRTNTHRKSQNTLIGEAISVLDHTYIDHADCTINVYRSNPDAPWVSSYLKKLFVAQVVQEEFGGRWNDWTNLEDEEDTGNHPAVDPEDIK